jgi:hypothetical protein
MCLLNLKQSFGQKFQLTKRVCLTGGAIWPEESVNRMSHLTERVFWPKNHLTKKVILPEKSFDRHIHFPDRIFWPGEPVRVFWQQKLSSHVSFRFYTSQKHSVKRNKTILFVWILDKILSNINLVAKMSPNAEFQVMLHLVPFPNCISIHSI